MPEVRNASNPAEVRGAAKRIARRQRRFFDALRVVMGSAEGRLVFLDREYGLIARAGVFRSVFNTHGGIQQHNIGKQDYGHELMALLIEADASLYRLGDNECFDRAERDRTETDLAHGREDAKRDDPAEDE